MISVTRKFEFSYAHWLPDYKGPCANMHGHNSNVEVEVASTAGIQAIRGNGGMIIDFKVLDKIVWDEVLSKLDHRLLNDVLPGDWAPTAENMAIHIFRMTKAIIEAKVPFCKVVRVRVSETSDSYAEITDDVI